MKIKINILRVIYNLIKVGLPWIAIKFITFKGNSWFDTPQKKKMIWKNKAWQSLMSFNSLRDNFSGIYFNTSMHNKLSKQLSGKSNGKEMS